MDLEPTKAGFGAGSLAECLALGLERCPSEMAMSDSKKTRLSKIDDIELSLGRSWVSAAPQFYSAAKDP